MPTFTATDGTVFTSRKEWRKYEFEKEYTCKNQEGTEVIKRSLGGQPFDVANCRNCTIVLADHTDQIQIDECEGCKIFVGACGESVFVRNCKDCVFYVACKQLRLRECEASKFSLYSQTEPVIEMSSEVVFSAFSGGYPDQEAHMRSANLDPAVNFWWGLYDFNDPEKTGQNFTVNQTPDEPWWPLGDATQVCVQTTPGHAPLPSTQDDSQPHSTPTAPSQSQGTFQSFDIRNTSQVDAARAVDNVLPPNPPANPEPTLTSPPTPPVGTDVVGEEEEAWEPVRVGIRYTPMVLAVQYKAPNQDTISQKDILVGDVKDDDTPETLLDRLSLDASAYLDFDKKLSKRQVLRLLGMLLDHHRTNSHVAA